MEIKIESQNRPKTVIGKANELIKELGKDEAIKVFQKRIDDLGEPKCFQDMCNISGWETAISHIKGEIMKNSLTRR